MTNSVIEKYCHRVMMGKTYWKGVVLPIKSSVRSRSNRHERKRNRQIKKKKKKTESTAMRRILRAPKWAAQAVIRGEIGISNMKSK